MSPTTAQFATLKAAALLDQNAAGYIASSNDQALADWLNAAVPTYYVWKTSTPVAEVFDKIVWANLTPVDTPDGTQEWTNRALACQGKQISLQIIFGSRIQLDSTRVSIRAGLKDALTNIPSGVAGASLGGGWNSVEAAMRRTASLAEQILATGAGTLANPAALGWEGKITAAEASSVRVA